MKSLIQNIGFIRVLAPQSAGTGTRKTSGVDCTGLDTIAFLIGIGTITSTSVITVKLQGSNTDVDGNYADLESTSFTVPDTDGSKLVLTEIIRPQYRYTRAVITIATANCVIDLVAAVTGINVRNVPVTQGSTVSTAGQDTNVSPVQGTA